MIIKIIILLFVIFVLWRTTSRYLRGDITVRELIMWVIFWLLVGLAVVLPQKTDIIAQWLGVSRGADLLVYLSIIVLFFVVFRIIVKLEKIDQEITKIVMEAALENDNKSKVQNQNVNSMSNDKIQNNI